MCKTYQTTHTNFKILSEVITISRGLPHNDTSVIKLSRIFVILQHAATCRTTDTRHRGLAPPLFLAADIFRKLTDMNKEIETEFECNYPHPDLKIFNAVSCILNYECRLYQKQSLKAN